MKFLLFASLTIFALTGITGGDGRRFYSEEFTSETSNAADLTEFFPEIAGCVRVVEPLRREGKMIVQTARYERPGYKENKNNPNYYGCGAISLRHEPGAAENRKTRARASVGIHSLFTKTYKINDFDAYRTSPQCGNDISIGAIEVYFDADKVLSVNAFQGAGEILSFAEKADYAAIEKTLNKLVD